MSARARRGPGLLVLALGRRRRRHLGPDQPARPAVDPPRRDPRGRPSAGRATTTDAPATAARFTSARRGGAAGVQRHAVGAERRLWENGPVTESPDEPATPQPEVATPTAEPVPPRPKKVGLLATIAASSSSSICSARSLWWPPSPPVNPGSSAGWSIFSLIRNSGAAFSMATGIHLVAGAGRDRRRRRDHPDGAPAALDAVGGLARPGARRRDRQPDRPDLPRRPGSCRATWSTSSRCSGPNAEYFPVFNVADSAITIGGISLVITALLGIDFDGTSTRKPKPRRQ